MSLKPIKISKSKKNSINIFWENGENTEIKNLFLRKYCPCAVCMNERSKQEDTYIPIFLLDQITITEIKSVGNYAIAINWEDGHKTGIYEYDILYRIAKLKN